MDFLERVIKVWAIVFFLACPPKEQTDTSDTSVDDIVVPDAQSCQGCHPQHFLEWEGSAMHLDKLSALTRIPP